MKDRLWCSWTHIPRNVLNLSKQDLRACLSTYMALSSFHTCVRFSRSWKWVSLYIYIYFLSSPYKNSHFTSSWRKDQIFAVEVPKKYYCSYSNNITEGLEIIIFFLLRAFGKNSMALNLSSEPSAVSLTLNSRFLRKKISGIVLLYYTINNDVPILYADTQEF